MRLCAGYPAHNPRRSACRAAGRRSLSEHSFSPRAARSGFEKLTFDVLDPERHELAFPWRFDRGHCGGKFAVDSPLEGGGFELPVPREKKSRNLGIPLEFNGVVRLTYRDQRSPTQDA